MARIGQIDKEAEAFEANLDAAITNVMQAAQTTDPARQLECRKLARAALREAIRLGSATPRY